MNNTQYVENIILDNIKKLGYVDLLKNTNRYAIYVCHLWIEELQKFVFKIGRTCDIKKRIISLNYEYKSNYKIKLIFYGKDDNINLEKDLHKEMKEFKIPHQKWRELYDITIEFYNEIKFFFEINMKNYFECDDYKIRSNKNQYYKLSDDLLPYFDDRPKNNNIKFLLLNPYTIEKFWRINHQLYRKSNYKRNF